MARRPRLLLTWIALAALVTPGCTQDLGSLDVPFRLGGSSAPSGERAPASERGERGEKSEPLGDCDDLPSLTPEELAGPPYEISLQRPSRPPSAEPPRYEVLPDVTLSADVAAKMAWLDDAFFKKTGKHLVVTSGTRDAARQAKAMHKMLRLGADIVRLYKNKAAAREVKQAYDENANKPADSQVEAMYAVLREQIRRGVFISAHLRAGAVDVRNRMMSAAEKRAFVKSVAELKGASLLEESKPPHYHLQLD